MVLWDKMQSVLKEPFADELDLLHLFLLVGLVLIFIIAWIFVLQHIRAAAMEAI